jgi:hypothetical protein
MPTVPNQPTPVSPYSLNYLSFPDIWFPTQNEYYFLIAQASPTLQGNIRNPSLPEVLNGIPPSPLQNGVPAVPAPSPKPPYRNPVNPNLGYWAGKWDTVPANLRGHVNYLNDLGEEVGPLPPPTSPTVPGNLS